MKERLCWLPVWEQAHEILGQLGVDSDTVAKHLDMSDAIFHGTERLELYRMIEQRLAGGGVAAKIH